jgi:hypothetical protein
VPLLVPVRGSTTTVLVFPSRSVEPDPLPRMDPVAPVPVVVGAGKEESGWVPDSVVEEDEVEVRAGLPVERWPVEFDGAKPERLSPETFVAARARSAIEKMEESTGTVLPSVVIICPAGMSDVWPSKPVTVPLGAMRNTCSSVTRVATPLRMMYTEPSFMANPLGSADPEVDEGSIAAAVTGAPGGGLCWKGSA